MGTLVGKEITYNTDAGTKTIRDTYQALDGWGTEVEGLANQQYRVRDGIYEYSGEVVYFWGGIEGGGGGSGGGGQGTGPDSPLLQVSSSAVSEPIEAHPAFDSIIASEWDYWNRWKSNPEDPILKGKEPTNEQGFWDPSKLETSTAGGTLYELYKRGTKEYYEPRVVIRQTIFESLPPVLSMVGKISEPPITVPNITNYILNSGEGKWNPKTGLWENTYEWIGSRKGWPVGIYGA
jgi:hypothetical protein